MQWDAATSHEIKKEIQNGRTTAFLPLGAIEQHGAHLVTGYDTWIAKKIAGDLAIEFRAWVLPSFEYGTSDHHKGFAGTFTLSESTVMALMKDLMESARENGIQKLVLVNGHGGNYSWMKKLGADYRGVKLVHDGATPILFSVIRELESKYAAGDLGLHAGLFETSMAMHTHRDAVRSDRMAPGLVPADRKKGWSDDEIRSFIAAGLKNSTPTGTIGDPKDSSAVLGERFFARVMEKFRALVAEI